MPMSDTTKSPQLSPAQAALARSAAGRLMELRSLHEAAGVVPMEGEALSIPLDELGCLCLAAAPAIGLDRDQFDLGPWH